MAERPDPDPDRRNILPGEHAKPDGTWCPYLAPSNEAGVWVCMKCGNSGGVSTPDTDPNTLADRLDVMSRNGYNPDAHDDLRAAADGLRQYAAITADDGRPLADHERSRWTAGEVRQMIQHAEELEAQLAAITAAISDLHRPMWDDPTAPGFYQTEPHREGDPAIGCCTCGTDGWPCPTAASLSPTPTPDHCPTCRGTWKIVRGQHPHYACSNVAWHDSQG